MNLNGCRLVLGSSSKWRARILERKGYVFTQMSPDIDEKAFRHPDPHTLTLTLARQKTEAVVGQLGAAAEPALVVCSDQVVTYNNTIREKPESVDEAREYITSYRRSSASTVTAVVVHNTANGKQEEAVDVATVYFKDISDEVMEGLIEKGEIFHCAGGFTIEDPLVEPCIERIDGTMDSIEGLPVHVVERLLEQVL